MLIKNRYIYLTIYSVVDSSFTVRLLNWTQSAFSFIDIYTNLCHETIIIRLFA